MNYKWLFAIGIMAAGLLAMPAYAEHSHHYHGATICYSSHGGHVYGHGGGHYYGHGHGYYRHHVSYYSYHRPHYYHGHHRYRHYRGYRGGIRVSTHSPKLSGHVNLRF